MHTNGNINTNNNNNGVKEESSNQSETDIETDSIENHRPELKEDKGQQGFWKKTYTSSGSSPQKENENAHVCKN